MNLGFHKSFSVLRWVMVLWAVTLVAAFAQEQQAQEPAAAGGKQEQRQKQPPPAENQPGINQQFGEPLAAESAKAAHAGAEESSEEKMVQDLKLSPSVRWMADHLHISPPAGYWVGYLFDFGLLALLLGFALRKNLPAMFRTRTRTIQHGIEEARKASEEANTRLAGIESRLAKLDSEIAGMRAAAEQEAVAEEQRILAAVEADKRHIIESAEAEITAAAKLARRELKAYAADLAVSIAERRIRVDAATDQALVRSFVGQLGEETGNGSGKDGK